MHKHHQYCIGKDVWANMRQAFALSISILILSLSLVSAAGKGGINVSIDLENTGISSVSSKSFVDVSFCSILSIGFF